MSDDIDMTGVDPVRWAEVRRRIRVIEAYRNLKKPAADDAQRAADELGISVHQFRRLERVWRAHRQASLVAKAGASRRRRRTMSTGLPDATRDIIRQTIRDLGTNARLGDIVDEAGRRCDAAATRRASDAAIWSKLMQERAANPVSSDPTPLILVGKCSFALPVEAPQGLFQPSAWLAVLMPEAVVIAADISLTANGQPNLAALVERLHDAEAPAAAPRPIVMSRSNLLAAGETLTSLLVHTAKGRQAHIASRLGGLLGGIGLADHAGRRDPERHIRSHLDAAVAIEDASVAINQAIANHNAQLRPSGPPGFRLAEAV